MAQIAPSHLPFAIQEHTAKSSTNGKLITLEHNGCERVDMFQVTHKSEHAALRNDLIPTGSVSLHDDAIVRIADAEAAAV